MPRFAASLIRIAMIVTAMLVGLADFSLAQPSGEWAVFPPPTAREGHSATYDQARDRMIVIGGSDLLGARSDVWELPLAGVLRWSLVKVAGIPPTPLSGHTAIYDSVRDRIIVFGGAAGTLSSETWSLNLSGTPTWSALSPADDPPAPRAYHTAIYDPLRDRMIVFGGFIGGGQHANDAWALNLSGSPNWVELAPTGTPPGGHALSAIYDPLRDRMVVLGGGAGPNEVRTLSLSGTPAWGTLTTAGTKPPDRFFHTAIYDPERDRVVVFAGADTASHNDVRVLSLGGTPIWSELSPTGSPPTARSRHTAIYDRLGDRMIMFGGHDGSYRNDVRALRLSGTPGWEDLGLAGLSASARCQHTATYDPVRERMVVFAGSDASQLRDDVRVLTLTGSQAWSTLDPMGTPPAARAYHSAIYDPPRDRILVWGGSIGGISDGLVWALNLSGVPEWSVLSPTGTPPSEWLGHSAIYDPVRDRMLIFGGGGGSNIVWALTLEGTPAWSVLSPAGPTPVGRYGHTAIYDPARDRMIIYGGYGPWFRDDIWALSFSGTPSWNEISAPAPPVGRYLHSAIFDVARDRMVIFGGNDSSVRDDIWALSFSGAPAWSELSPTGAPPSGRYAHSAILDPVGDRMVVFGGLGESSVFDESWELSWYSLVSVEPPGAPVTTRFEFAAPRPNPSRGSVSLEFSIPSASTVSLVVHDGAGRVVATVADRSFVPGRHALVWDCRNASGQTVPSGIYFVRLRAPGVVLTRKTVILQ